MGLGHSAGYVLVTDPHLSFVKGEHGPVSAPGWFSLLDTASQLITEMSNDGKHLA